MEFVCLVLVVIAGYFVINNLPDILKNRGATQVEIEKERTQQKSLELERAKLETDKRA